MSDQTSAVEYPDSALENVAWIAYAIAHAPTVAESRRLSLLWQRLFVIDHVRY